MSLHRDGYLLFAQDAAVTAWVRAAKVAAQAIEMEPKRHGNTWFVGVDALPNLPDGSIGGTPLCGPWDAHVKMPANWHRAQLSVVFPGYPGQDPTEPDAAHRYRLLRDAAHVDGLLPEGPNKRRHLREPHGFILGLPLSDVRDSPLVVWQGSHLIMQAAFARAYADVPEAEMGDLDVTDIYQAARREVFETCNRVEVPAKAGEATLLHRHVVHGVAPWGDGRAPRPIAYFRPTIRPKCWLRTD